MRSTPFSRLLLPGGVANADQLRMLPAAVEFVRSFFAAGKPVAVICHGPKDIDRRGCGEGTRHHAVAIGDVGLTRHQLHVGCRVRVSNN
jgi:hypothetical protein